MSQIIAHMREVYSKKPLYIYVYITLWRWLSRMRKTSEKTPYYGEKKTWKHFLQTYAEPP